MDPFKSTLLLSPASSLRSIVFAPNPAAVVGKPDGTSSRSGPSQSSTMLPPSPPTSPDEPSFHRPPTQAPVAGLHCDWPSQRSRRPRSPSIGLSCTDEDDGGGSRAGLVGDELSFLSDEWQPPTTPSDYLDVNDRQQMGHFMTIECSKTACQMAAEVVGIIIPALPKRAGYSSAQRSQAAGNQEKRVVHALLYWTGLSPHPLCVLVSTVILLERLSLLYPAMATLPSFSDTPLRVLFSAFLIALKWTCDVSHMNASFARYTSWTVRDICRMEREMLECLRWDVYVSAEELLHRAAGFYSAHLASTARLSGADDGMPASGPAMLGNLFLMQPREGVDERSWKHGLVKAPGAGGSRIPSSPERSIADDGYRTDAHSDRAPRSRGCSEPVTFGVGVGLGGGSVAVKGGEETVWRGGRLERSGSEKPEMGTSRKVSQTTQVGRRTSV